MEKSPGDSREQQDAEKDLLKGYFNKIHLPFVEKKKFDIEGNGWIEIDGFCEAPVNYSLTAVGDVFSYLQITKQLRILNRKVGWLSALGSITSQLQ
jgi:hypothetical protein